MRYTSGLDIYITGDNCGMNWTVPVKLVEIKPGIYFYGLDVVDCGKENMLVKIFLMDGEVFLPHIGSLYEIGLDGNDHEGIYLVQPRFRGEIGEIRVLRDVYSSELDNYRDIRIWKMNFLNFKLLIFSWMGKSYGDMFKLLIRLFLKGEHSLMKLCGLEYLQYIFQIKDIMKWLLKNVTLPVRCVTPLG